MNGKDSDLALTIFHIIGYILAVPPLFSIGPALANKKRAWPSKVALLAELSGTLIIIIGWVLRGNPIAVAINSTWLIVFSWFWYKRSRKS